MTNTMKEDILVRLQNGEQAEDIAKELVDALNAANDTFQKEQEAQKAKEAEKAAEVRKYAAKVEDLQEILDLLHDFCIEYYCDGNDDINVVDKAFDEYKAETVIQMIEDLGAYVADLNKVQKELNHAFGSLLGDVPVVKVKKVEKDPDEVINGFLRKLGL
jgi:uncharacterized phage infection (PIP) family protein YhgE